MRKKSLKRGIVAVIASATMMLGVASQAFAVGSITAVISAPATDSVASVTLSDGTSLDTTNLRTVVAPVQVSDVASVTSNDAVASLISSMDATDTAKSVQDILDTIKATLGTDVLPITFADPADASYDLTKAVGLSNFAEVYLQQDGQTVTGVDAANVKVEVPNVKDMDAAKAATIRVMCVDPVTGAIVIVKPVVDTTTGTLTVDLSNFDSASGKVLMKVIYQP